MTQAQIISSLVIGLISALVTLVVGLYTINRTFRAKQLELAALKEKQDLEGSATIKIGLIGNRDMLEERIIARLEAQDAKLESEREKRHALEELIQANKIEIADLRAAVARYQEQEAIAKADHRFQMEGLAARCLKLEDENKELRALCKELQDQLAAARGHSIQGALAGNIGVAEVPRPKRDIEGS